jgi:drug/metabolite transporter (DMT)-like permease
MTAAGPTDRLGRRRTLGLTVGFAGVLVLAAPQLGGDGWSIAEVLLAAACYATAPLIATRWLNDVPAAPMTAACLALAALVCSPAAVTTWPKTAPSVPALAAIVGLAVMCTALALVAFFALIREAGASRALVVTYVNPAVAVLAGVFVLAEPFTIVTMLSFAMIISGSFLAAGPESAPKPPGAAAAPATGDRTPLPVLSTAGAST